MAIILSGWKEPNSLLFRPPKRSKKLAAASERDEKPCPLAIGSCETRAKALRQSSLHDCSQPGLFSVPADAAGGLCADGWLLLLRRVLFKPRSDSGNIQMIGGY